MARADTPLYVGTGSFVAALDPRTGDELWRTKLPHTSATPVTILIQGQNLYVGNTGRVYCLDRRSGHLIWENGLKRMGWGAVLLVMEGATGCCGQGEVLSDHDRRRRQAAAGAGGAAAAT